MPKLHKFQVGEVQYTPHQTTIIPGVATFETLPDLRGPKFWAELHSYPWRILLWDSVSARVFYGDWLRRAGEQFGGCCQVSVDRLLLVYPVNVAHLESAFAFFRFSWDVHNTVNRELGRKPFGFEAAIEQWKPKEDYYGRGESKPAND